MFPYVNLFFVEVQEILLELKYMHLSWFNSNSDFLTDQTYGDPEKWLTFGFGQYLLTDTVITTDIPLSAVICERVGTTLLTNF